MDLKSPAYRTPLARALGLGSAHDGTGHWWLQRLTAVALIPLTLWLVWFLARLDRLSFEAMRAWLAQPWHGALLLAYLSTAGYHAVLGLQVVVEDYVHRPALKLAALIGIRLGLGLAVLTGAVALVRLVAVGGGG